MLERYVTSQPEDSSNEEHEATIKRDDTADNLTAFAPVDSKLSANCNQSADQPAKLLDKVYQ